MLCEKHISKFLRYSDHDLPALANKIQKLTSDVIELEFRKKICIIPSMLQRTQLSDLGQAIISIEAINSFMMNAYHLSQNGILAKNGNEW